MASSNCHSIMNDVMTFNEPEGKGLNNNNAHQINLAVEVFILDVAKMHMGVLNIYVTAVAGMAPMGVNVTRISATVMVVSWVPLSYSEARGFISHYTIFLPSD